jgi:hypothetical protein
MRNHCTQNPLARTEIGQNSLQDFDYFYTLQGWMKGINTISTENDPGQDDFSGVNSTFGKDLAAFSDLKIPNDGDNDNIIQKKNSKKRMDTSWSSNDFNAQYR